MVTVNMSLDSLEVFLSQCFVTYFLCVIVRCKKFDNIVLHFEVLKRSEFQSIWHVRDYEYDIHLGNRN